MKKLLLLGIVLTIVLLFSCVLGVSFEEISQPYLDQYGPPKKIVKFTSNDYHWTDWWWWSQGFRVTFEWTTYDNVRGWVVGSTYSFPPI